MKESGEQFLCISIFQFIVIELTLHKIAQMQSRAVVVHAFNPWTWEAETASL